MKNERIDEIVNENIDNEKIILELTEKLNLAIEALSFYQTDYDNGLIADETLDQIHNFNN